MLSIYELGTFYVHFTYSCMTMLHVNLITLSKSHCSLYYLIQTQLNLCSNDCCVTTISSEVLRELVNTFQVQSWSAVPLWNNNEYLIIRRHQRNTQLYMRRFRCVHFYLSFCDRGLRYCKIKPLPLIQDCLPLPWSHTASWSYFTSILLVFSSLLGLRLNEALSAMC